MAEAVARHFTVQAERSEAARVTAQVERDACSATARLLERAGWHERAAATMAAAPNPACAAAPLLPTTDGIISLRPTNVRSKASSAIPPRLSSGSGVGRGGGFSDLGWAPSPM